MSAGLLLVAGCKDKDDSKTGFENETGTLDTANDTSVDTARDSGRDTGVDTGRDTAGDTGRDTFVSDTSDTGVVSGDCGETVEDSEVTFAVSSQSDIDDAVSCFESSYSTTDNTLVLSLQADMAASVSFSGLNVKILGNAYTLSSNDSSDESSILTALGGSLSVENVTLDGLNQSTGIYATDSASLSVVDTTVTAVESAGIYADDLSIVELNNVEFSAIENLAQAAVVAEDASWVEMHGVTISNAESDYALQLDASEIVLSGLRIDGEDSVIKTNNFALGGLELSSDVSTTVDSLYFVDSDLGNGNVVSVSGSGTAYVRNTTFVQLSSVDTVFSGALVASNGVTVDVDMLEFESGTSYVGYQTFDGDFGMELPSGDQQMDDAAGTISFTSVNGFEYEVDYTTSGGDVTNGIASDPAAGYRGAHSGRGEVDLLTQ